MDIHQLKLFLAVIESRNMTHAAQQFHLSPGAVSLQLHSLSAVVLVALPLAERNVKLLTLFEAEPLVLRPSQNSARSTRIGVIQTSDIAHVLFLLYPKRSNIRTIIDQFFQEINISSRVVMEAEDSEAIKGLVESGFG